MAAGDCQNQISDCQKPPISDLSIQPIPSNGRPAARSQAWGSSRELSLYAKRLQLPTSTISMLAELLMLSPAQLTTLHSLMDRIVPPDEDPGAWEAGVGDYLARQSDRDLHDCVEQYRPGLATQAAEAL